MSKKLNTSSDALSPATFNGNGKNGDASKMPTWMIEAGFRSFTRYSNDTLEAIMMDDTREYKERIFAYCARFSWGYDCEIVMAGSYAARNKDIAALLGIAESHVSSTLKELAEEGLIEIKDRLITPQTRPPSLREREKAKAAKAKADFPDFAAWRKVREPELVPHLMERYRIALDGYNDARKQIRKAADEVLKPAYELEREKALAQRVTGTGSLENLPAPVTEDVVQGEKSSLYEIPSLIHKAHNLKLASLGAKPHPDKPEEEAEKTLAASIVAMQRSGIYSRLGNASATTVRTFLQYGTASEIHAFLLYLAAKHMSDHWITWGLAHNVIKADMPAWVRDHMQTWLEEQAALAAAPTAEPEPEPVMTEHQQIEQSIEIALSLLDRGAPLERKHAAATVAKYEAENPELVASVRSRLARGNARTNTSGGAA